MKKARTRSGLHFFNPFKGTNVQNYFHTPALPLVKQEQMNARDFRFWLYLMSQKALSVTLTASEIAVGTGIKRQHQKAVRDSLVALDLISIVNESGHWHFTLLHPLTKAPIRHLTYLGQDTLTGEQIEFFYSYIFAQRRQEWSRLEYKDMDGGLKTSCPFCFANSFHVRIPKPGDLDGGVWKCNRQDLKIKAGPAAGSKMNTCGKAGNIVHFMVDLMVKDDPKLGHIPYESLEDKARWRIENILQKIGAEQPVSKATLPVCEDIDDDTLRRHIRF